MLKIVDNIDLKELEKFGFKYYKKDKCYIYEATGDYDEIYIDEEDRLIQLNYEPSPYFIEDCLYYLIKDGLVEKIKDSIDLMWEQEEQRRNKYFKTLGNYLGYDSKKCISCGRFRVNIFDNGNRVCEKCGTDQKTGEYYYNKYGSWLEFDI